MTRFNLICHGMMLFIEEGDQVRILIPQVDTHAYKFGSPQSVQGVCQGTLNDLPTGSFTMTGPVSSGRKLTDMVSSKDHLMLHQESFDIAETTARNTIVIPKPDLVRLYRPVEVLDQTSTVFGGADTKVALEVPTFLHDAVCFSYTKLPDATVVSIGTWFQVTPAQVDPQGRGSTLCIYAQDTNDSGPDVPHVTAINGFLQPKAGGLANFNLSRVGEADGGPDTLASDTVVDRCQLRNLIELKGSISFTSRTGCTGAFVVPTSGI